MKLLTKEIVKRLPGLYSTEHIPLADKIVQAKFFSPWTSWTWYPIEYDPVERVFFGYVVGHESEFGNFALDELLAVRGPGGLGIERNLHFRPTRLGNLLESAGLRIHGEGGKE